ncbi:glycyl-radical enzyme activating protein [Lachnospiraceae bacterium oral taxon 500]|nr:glycyl-radical enzyme activating protein [Lachnospiraceae bacterium oral taxon 500]
MKTDSQKETGMLLEIQRFCLHDGPGIRTTVFFKGCPLRCKWCSNPESQSFRPQLQFVETSCIRCGRCIKACPAGAMRRDPTGKTYHLPEKCGSHFACVAVCPTKALRIAGRRWTVEAAVHEIEKDKVFFREGGGVTFSGGEVLAQIDFAERLAEALHQEGIHITCETTGFSSEESFRRLLRWCDLLYFDVKHWDSRQHLQGTGVEVEKILDHLKLAIDARIPLAVRIPVIPRFNDQPEDQRQFCQLLKKYQIQEVHLLPFHQFGSGKYQQLGLEYEYQHDKSMKKEELEGFAEMLRQEIPKVQIGG